MSRPITTGFLAKLALGGGIMCIGMVTCWVEKIQYDMRMTESYQQAMILFWGYEAGVELIGKPIHVKRLDLSTKGPNKVAPTFTELTIPLKGDESKGNLFVWSSRNSIKDKWEIEKLALEVENLKQKWTFYQNPKFANKKE